MHGELGPGAERALVRLLMPGAWRWRGRRRCVDGDGTAEAPPCPESELYGGAGGRRLRRGTGRRGCGGATSGDGGGTAAQFCIAGWSTGWNSVCFDGHPFHCARPKE
jgi:hypothetical protein